LLYCERKRVTYVQPSRVRSHCVGCKAARMHIAL
jgi:hypothetical protein